ncbi:unnamed protein product [Taenia asiatica]|uniref:Protein kinase domain-containing protein n=1 Tax=Taenia asiatica TaxID=60517 RepID=A0A0R3WFT0_TAEAS|nr:unnamed protein product [Taenia asiatica]
MRCDDLICERQTIVAVDLSCSTYRLQSWASEDERACVRTIGEAAETEHAVVFHLRLISHCKMSMLYSTGPCELGCCLIAAGLNAADGKHDSLS